MLSKSEATIMKCFGIYRQINDQEAEQVDNVSWITRATATNAFKQHKVEMIKRIQDIGFGSITVEKAGYYFYCLKNTEGFAVICLDTPLERLPIIYLTDALLYKNEPLKEVLANPEAYLIDRKIAKINIELEQTKEVLMQAMEKVIDRGDKLEQLVEKTEALQQTSFQFHEATKELNRCCNWW
jgi:synaptobrevin homolog YKT6